VFDSINNNHIVWEKNIASAWDRNLATDFASSISFMMDEIHITNIFQLNEYIKSINNIRINSERNEEEIESEKKRVKAEVSAIMKTLEIKIPILENRFNEILTRMQHSEI
jgi:hypothetical protein